MAYDFAAADAALILNVWRKATVIPGYAPAIWRQDMCGVMIRFDQHGSDGENGWVISPVIPLAKGGPNHIDNFVPLSWDNHDRKADRYPWNC